MTLGRVAVLVGVAFLVLVVNVAMSILYMVVYSYLIDPGHDQAYYEEHVKVAAPYCSIVAGMPLMFLAGWWVSRSRDARVGVHSALIVWLAYAVIDLAILAGAGVTAWVGVLVAVSLVTKLAAAYFGAIVAQRQR